MMSFPVLSFFTLPGPPSDPLPQNDQERVAIDAMTGATMAYINRWKQSLLTGVPQARIVDLPGSGHFVFLTRESEVLEEVRTFVAGLTSRDRAQ